MISPATIEKIREAARIEEVVGERLELRRRGSSLVACCPFHDEKTPSFHVNPARNFYHCFGCQAHGDSIRFVMEFEHKTYPEALRVLAERYHIPVEERQLTDEERQQQDDRQSVRRVLQAVVEWGKEQFKQLDGQRYWQVLLQDWGIREDTATTYELGCIPRHDDLLNYLKTNGYDEHYIRLAGLMDVDFSDSILFPFFSMSGELQTLGAIPVSPPKGEPEGVRMLGLPESPMFNADNRLFGIREAVHRMKKDTPIYWVRSALDALRLVQTDRDLRVVATPLSSLTEFMLKKVLTRFTHRLVLVCPEHLQYNPQWVNRCAWIMQQGLTLSILLEPDASQTSQTSLTSPTSPTSQTSPIDFLQQQLDRVSQLPQAERTGQLEVFLRLLLFEQDPVVRDCYLHSASDALHLPYTKLQQVMQSFG